MLTNKEHDDLWRAAFAKVPKIADELRRSNAIECVKELTKLGHIDSECCAKFLLSVLNDEGYELG